MTAARRIVPPLAALLGLGAWSAAAPSPSAVRQELDAMATALDRAVRQVSRTLPFALSAQRTRAYALAGVGAVFVLPPRDLPVRRGPRAADPPAARALADARAALERSLRGARSPERKAQIERSLDALRQAEAELQRRARPEPRVAPTPAAAPRAPAAAFPPDPARLPEEGETLFELPSEVQAQLAAEDRLMRTLAEGPLTGRAMAEQYQAEVRALYAQAEAFRREAERAREEAERAVRDQLGAEPPDLAGPAPPAPPEPPVSAVPPVPPPAPVMVAPPWEFWFHYDESAEPEEAEDVVASVKDAVVRVLEAQGSRLTRVAPAESVVVAVDFVSRLGNTPPRTLVLRVRKKDLDERKAGRLGADAFRSRVETDEY